MRAGRKIVPLYSRLKCCTRSWRIAADRYRAQERGRGNGSRGCETPTPHVHSARSVFLSAATTEVVADGRCVVYIFFFIIIFFSLRIHFLCVVCVVLLLLPGRVFLFAAGEIGNGVYGSCCIELVAERFFDADSTGHHFILF